MKIVWFNVVYYILLHLLGIWALFDLPNMHCYTIICLIVLHQLGCWGVTAGAHRLWSHRSFKAKFMLRLLLSIFFTLAMQNSIFVWARDHRVHHKHTDSDADPHDARRGFFFSHMGWLMVRKSDAVRSEGSKLMLDDLKHDPLVKFQHRYYRLIAPIISVILPTLLPIWFWQETFINAFLACVLRYLWTLHSTWLVNSAAHKFGFRPFDKSIKPAENFLVCLLASGEGWHNYHHAFPYDYSTSEWLYSLNTTTMFIDAMAKIGLAYDRKKASNDVIMARIKRTGDTNSH